MCAVAVFLAVASAGDSPAQAPPAPAESAASPIQWAKPLKGGPVRAAAVVPIDGVADLSALERGFDVRLETRTFGEAGAESPDQAVAAALAAQNDALIASSVTLADLSPATREALAARVQSGMGLLWVSFATNGLPELREFLAPLGLVAVENPPDFAARAGGAALADLRPGFDEAAAYTGPQGRAVELRFWRQRPVGHALLPLTPSDALDAPMNVENYRALAGRALLWSARRDPEAVLLRIDDRASEGPSAVSTPPQLPQQFIERMKQAALPGVLRPYAVVLDRPAPRKYALRVQARYPDRGIQWSYAAEEMLGKGMSEVLLAVPTGAGRCFLDVWLMDGPKVVDWLTQALDLPNLPGLGNVTFSRAAIEPNDRLRISAEVQGRLAPLSDSASARAQDVLFLRVTDVLGRVVAKQNLVVPPQGAEMIEEFALADVLGPYLRAEVLAATAGDSPLTPWLRERAAYRSANLLVRQPLPPGLAIIVDEAGEGSFAGSARRRALAARGVDFIFPGAEPDFGNVAADGMRAIGRLGDLTSAPGDVLDARSRPGVALRQAAARYAPVRPGLYVVTLANVEAAPAEALEKKRLSIERVVRQIDPRAHVALLDGDLSAAGTGGFRILPADPAAPEGRASAPGEYVAIRAPLPEGDRALERCRWLPWFAALRQANALWISPQGTEDEAGRLYAVLAEAGRVREGFDVLFARAKPAPFADDPRVQAPKNFSSLAARFEFGKATIYAYLADPAAGQKATFRFTAETGSQVYNPMAIEARGSRGLQLKLGPGEAAVACVLPYQVSRIALELPRTIAAGRRLTVHATVKTHGALPGDHILRMNCFDLGGRPLNHYSRTMIARDGAGATWLPLAFNETPGSYRIVVRDLFSGIEVEEWFMIEANPENAPASLR